MEVRNIKTTQIDDKINIIFVIKMQNCHMLLQSFGGRKGLFLAADILLVVQDIPGHVKTPIFYIMLWKL